MATTADPNMSTAAAAAVATSTTNTNAAAQTPTKDVKAAVPATDPNDPAPTSDSAKAGTGTKTESTDEKKTTTNAPLAPPPRPSQPGTQASSDQFGPTNSTHFSLEPNPFEQSFGQPSDNPKSFPQTLPSVQSLTSPAILGPGATPGWEGLRTGPLSPAMLTGPTGAHGDDYFSSFRQSFPTPNESSVRGTGLTPGGPSMFPAPSPNSQAIFNSIQNGGATPGTVEFHRSAMSAKARAMPETTQASATSSINKSDYQPAQQQQQIPSNPFNNNSESDAVNSLYMLANNGQRNTNQFSMPSQQPQGLAGIAQMRPGASMNQTANNHRGQHQSIGGMSASTGSGMDGYGSETDVKASGKKPGKKGPKSGTNGRRKAEDMPSKAPASKKAKGNGGSASMMDMDMDDDDDDDDENKDNETGPGGRKLTDEEKRKNFLERNRVAALKCRQRKKQWLANLQAKVEIFTTENDALTNQCAQLREENQNLKALLIQHKDCAVSHSQGLGGARMAQVLGAEFEGPAYGMGMNQQGMMMQQHAGR